MDDLKDEQLDETENADALLDDSIFEETDLDLIDEEDTLKNLDDDTIVEEEENPEDEEILDELDALAAEEEDDEGFDYYGDEDEY